MGVHRFGRASAARLLAALVCVPAVARAQEPPASPPAEAVTPPPPAEPPASPPAEAVTPPPPSPDPATPPSSPPRPPEIVWPPLDAPARAGAGKPADAAPKAGGASGNSMDEPVENALKPDVATLGAPGTPGWRNRVAVQAGLDLVGESLYVGITPGANFSYRVLDRPLSVTLAAPLRIRILDARAEDRVGDLGRFHREDWDEPGDWIQILQNVTWGGEEDDFFLLDLDQYETETLHQGALVRRYAPNLTLASHRVALDTMGYSRWAAGEVYVDSLAEPHVVGGHAQVHPLSFFRQARKDYRMRTFWLGASIASDVDAPLRNRLDADDADDDGRRLSEVLLDPVTHRPSYHPTSVIGWGVDTGIRVIHEKDRKTGVDVAWDTYADYSFLASGVPDDDPTLLARGAPPTRGVMSGGFTWGNLLRVDLGGRPRHVLRARLEYRNHDPDYLPGYFGLLYDIERSQYRTGSADPAAVANRTKLQEVFGRGGSRPNGGLIELTYLLGRWLVVGMGFEFNDRTPDNHMFATPEVPDMFGWQLALTYHRRNADGAASLWRWFGDGGYDVVVARTRYEISVFAVAIEAMTPFGIDPDNTLVPKWEVDLALELGWTFGKLLGKGGER
ncbi:MAG: hypothetical protein FJ087_17200 [Deltaproteobacteria bacterium]|nr:hypothetical protein [Deltaproteobacteria bacterium]